MSKALFVLVIPIFLLASGPAFAASVGSFGGAFKVGVDFAGNWANSTPWGDYDYDTETSMSIGAEGYYLISKYFDIGAGIQYVFEREIKLPPGTTPGMKFWFVPIYGVFRFHPVMGDYTPYGILQLGYSFHDGNALYLPGVDKDGGLYWGGGAGFIFKRHILFEILYSESRGEFRAIGIRLDVTHRRATFSVGYNF